MVGSKHEDRSAMPLLAHRNQQAVEQPGEG